MAERFNVVITDVLRQLASVKTVTAKERNRQPWFDQEMQISRSRARRLERRALTSTKSLNLELSGGRLLNQIANFSIRKLHHICNQRSTQRPEILVDCGKNINKVLSENVKINAALSAANYHDMIDGKVANIVDATTSADPQTYIVNSPSSS